MINQQLIKRSLVINVEDGVNADGSTRTKSRTYSEIKEDSAVENLYEAGNALASLMAKHYAQWQKWACRRIRNLPMNIWNKFWHAIARILLKLIMWERK